MVELFAGDVARVACCSLQLRRIALVMQACSLCNLKNEGGRGSTLFEMEPACLTLLRRATMANGPAHAQALSLAATSRKERQAFSDAHASQQGLGIASSKGNDLLECLRREVRQQRHHGAHGTGSNVRRAMRPSHIGLSLNLPVATKRPSGGRQHRS